MPPPGAVLPSGRHGQLCGLPYLPRSRLRTGLPHCPASITPVGLPTSRRLQCAARGGARPGDRVCDPRGPRIEPSVMILGAEFDGFPIHDGWAPYYRFLLAFHQSCLPVCRSAAARWRGDQGVPARLGRNLFASGRAFAAEEPGVARFAKISERGLRIATGRLEASLDRILETAPQPGKSGLFPISNWLSGLPDK